MLGPLRFNKYEIRAARIDEVNPRPAKADWDKAGFSRRTMAQYSPTAAPANTPHLPFERDLAEYPAFSNPVHVSSRKIRCGGSIAPASACGSWTKSGSNLSASAMIGVPSEE